MTDEGGYLRRQFETAWLLTDLHLTGLGTEECLWRPASQGMHVHRAADGTWRADWPEHERYDLGPPSIAWPFRDRPFGDVVAWVNIELTKNASELGYARFLYAVRR